MVLLARLDQDMLIHDNTWHEGKGKERNDVAKISLIAVYVSIGQT